MDKREAQRLDIWKRMAKVPWDQIHHVAQFEQFKLLQNMFEARLCKAADPFVAIVGAAEFEIDRDGVIEALERIKAVYCAFRGVVAAPDSDRDQRATLKNPALRNIARQARSAPQEIKDYIDVRLAGRRRLSLADMCDRNQFRH
jgi:hypothetical protein